MYISHEKKKIMDYMDNYGPFGHYINEDGSRGHNAYSILPLSLRPDPQALKELAKNIISGDLLVKRFSRDILSALKYRASL